MRQNLFRSSVFRLASRPSRARWLPLLFALVFGAALALSLCRGAAAQATLVDLELVLAIDISGSIDDEEARLQREGYLAAFQHPDILKAIRTGAHGRIAVTYVEWAGDHTRRTVADWTVLHDDASAKALVATVSESPLTIGMWTSISGAIEYGREKFRQSPYKGKRRVIDISGDGPNNHGEFVLTARDRAIKEGIVINGLPIVNNKPSRWGMPQLPHLDLYYEDCVIGGNAAFIIVANTFHDFARAVRQKLVLEIASRTPEKPLIEFAKNAARLPAWRTAFVTPRPWDQRTLLVPVDAPKRPDCLQGERQMRTWRDR